MCGYYSSYTTTAFQRLLTYPSLLHFLLLYLTPAASATHGKSPAMRSLHRRHPSPKSACKGLSANWPVLCATPLVALLLVNSVHAGPQDHVEEEWPILAKLRAARLAHLNSVASSSKNQTSTSTSSLGESHVDTPRTSRTSRTCKHRASKEPQVALESLKEAVKNEPTSLGVRHDLSQVYMELGREDLALRHLDIALSLPRQGPVDEFRARRSHILEDVRRCQKQIDMVMQGLNAGLDDPIRLQLEKISRPEAAALQ